MESGEHTIVGDAGGLPGLPTPALQVQGIGLSYGHIVALAGDFYGVPGSPICQGATGSDRQTRFAAALATLLHPTSMFGPALGQAELAAVVSLIDAEVAALQPAIAKPTPTGASDIYHGLSGGNAWSTLYTRGQYVLLSANNVDHFGFHAQQAYLAGHRLAIAMAVAAHNKKPPFPGLPVPTLADAYIANAFADHFLTDLFSAGHLRTPRAALHSWSSVGIPGVGAVGDVLSWYGHDEDCKYGLNVSTSAGQFFMYGDKRIFDSVNSQGLAAAKAAVLASKQEILQAYESGVDPFAGLSLDALPNQVHCKALALAPDPVKAAEWQSNPDHRILFYFNTSMGPSNTLLERKNVNDVKDYNYVECATGMGTYVDLKSRYTL